MIYLVSYVATAAVFLVLDAIWLTVTTPILYRPALGPALLEPPNMVAAILFYLLFVGGTVLFAVHPAVASGRWPTALLLGAAFGFIAYATYDLTNLATLRIWTVPLAVVDILWGTVVTATSATLGFVIGGAVVRWFEG